MAKKKNKGLKLDNLHGAGRGRRVIFRPHFSIKVDFSVSLLVPLTPHDVSLAPGTIPEFPSMDPGTNLTVIEIMVEKKKKKKTKRTIVINTSY